MPEVISLIWRKGDERGHPRLLAVAGFSRAVFVFGREIERVRLGLALALPDVCQHTMGKRARCLLHLGRG